VCRFSFKLNAPAKNLIVAVPIWDSNGILVTSLNSDVQQTDMKARANETVSGALHIGRLPLNPGQYTSMLVVHDGRECLYRNFIHAFKVREMPVYHGFVTPEHDWQFQITV
jgi:hypothetical protein